MSGNWKRFGLFINENKLSFLYLSYGCSYIVERCCVHLQGKRGVKRPNFVVLLSYSKNEKDEAWKKAATSFTLQNSK
jgi:hypothetical protein